MKRMRRGCQFTLCISVDEFNIQTQPRKRVSALSSDLFFPVPLIDGCNFILRHHRFLII